MPRHGENIHKRKDGRWEGRYNTGKSFSGKQTYISVYGKTYTEVKNKMVELSKETTERAQISGNSKSLSDVILEWQNKNRLKHKGATEAKYDYMIKTHIIPIIGDISIKKVTAEYLNFYAEEQLNSGRIDDKGGLSASYVRTIMIILTSVINYAVSEQYCSPLKGKIFKPSIDKSSLNIIDVSEQRKLETYLFYNRNLTNFGILISLYMGLRIGEVCALSWKDVDLKNSLIHISGTVTRIKNTDLQNGGATCLVIDKPKTKTSDRDIPIPSKLLPLFNEFYSSRKSEYILSENKSFLNPRTYEYRYHSVLKQCGLPDMNYHSLRHTFATRCIEVGVDVKTLSEILGHADVSITLNTYVHSSMNLKRKQMEKLCLISGQ